MLGLIHALGKSKHRELVLTVILMCWPGVSGKQGLVCANSVICWPGVHRDWFVQLAGQRPWNCYRLYFDVLA